MYVDHYGRVSCVHLFRTLWRFGVSGSLKLMKHEYDPLSSPRDVYLPYRLYIENTNTK